MIKELIKLANHLDSKGLVKEADYLDGIIKSANPATWGPTKENARAANKASSGIIEEWFDPKSNRHHAKIDPVKVFNGTLSDEDKLHAFFKANKQPNAAAVKKQLALQIAKMTITTERPMGLPIQDINKLIEQTKNDSDAFELIKMIKSK